MALGIINSFKGGMNMDDSHLQLPPDSYIDALNITIDSVERNQDYAATNIVGNRRINYSLPTGTNVVIGKYEDLIRNRIIYFVWNSYSQHLILKYNNTTRTITKILANLTDTGGIDILQFSRYKKIIHTEVVHRDEGDLLYWTDGNVSPKGLIIDKVEAGTYGTVELDFIEAAKSPPLQPPTVSYGDDATRITNSLRKKLYQIRYRWVYDDYSRSTWSPWSDTPLPANLVGTDADSDPTKNNYIAATITTGNKNVTDIEIGFRELAGNNFGDMFMTVSLNKSALSLADSVEYQYSFYNDNIPTLLDTREALLLFDYFPLLAKSMVLANGNVLVYGAITEGYDNIAQNELDVQMTTEAVRNTGVDTGVADITYFVMGTSITFTVVGQVLTGAVYSIYMFIPTESDPYLLATYTALAGDDANDVAMGLYSATSVLYQTIPPATNTWTCSFPPDSYIQEVIIIPGSGSSGVATGTGWPWYSRYRFGLVYFDEKGRTNGVQTYVNQPSDNADFEIETGAFQLDGGTPKTYIINAEINHLPPSWAVKYCWVRSNNRTFDRLLYYTTCDFQSDTDYYYLGLQNIEYFYSKNSQFIYNNISSTVREGDRVRIVAKTGTGGYTGTIWDDDYQILGVVDRVPTAGGDEQKFVKIKKPVSAPSPSYSENMLVMVYTPISNTGAQDKTVYWEFDQFYDITGGYHMGQLQNQTAVQAATFQFTNGDYYYRQRNMFLRIAPSEISANLLLFDINYSDFYPSAVNGNGRAEVVEVNAKQTYYPATVRFGQEFEPNTTINNLNRFYPGNFKDYNRVYGGILKMRIRDQYLKLGQQLKIGVVPINLQIVKTLDGSGQLTASDELLNTVNYYSGEFGVGDCPEAWASFNFADYFIDNRRGMILRLSQDGITPISLLYKANSWASVELPLRDGATSFCYGAYDQKLNNYILAIEASGSSEAQTIIFGEEENIFESFVSYKPEMMCMLGNLLITFKDGELWTHDSEAYNNFYGVEYESHITPVFSQPGLEKKGWQSVNMISDGTWDAPLIYTNVNTYGSQRQETNLVAQEFTLLEGNPSASIKRASNSRGGKINGDYIKGNWIAIKLRKQNAQNLAYLNIVSCKFVESPLTVQ